jgi:hypothetical protein
MNGSEINSAVISDHTADTEKPRKAERRQHCTQSQEKLNGIRFQSTARLQYHISDKIAKSRLILSAYLNCGKGFRARNPAKIDDRGLSGRGLWEPWPTAWRLGGPGWGDRH